MPKNHKAWETQRAWRATPEGAAKYKATKERYRASPKGQERAREQAKRRKHRDPSSAQSARRSPEALAKAKLNKERYLAKPESRQLARDYAAAYRQTPTYLAKEEERRRLAKDRREAKMLATATLANSPEGKAQRARKQAALVARWGAANPEAVKIIKARYRHSDNGRAAKRADAQRWRFRLNNPISPGVCREQWLFILEAFGHVCAYCLRPGKLTRDHIVPLAKRWPGRTGQCRSGMCQLQLQQA